MSNVQKTLLNTLYQKYGSMSVSKKDAAKIIGIGMSTLDKMRSEGKGPDYKQYGVGKVQYNLSTLVDYILADEIKTA